MAADPYKYFRVEARELLDGLTEGVLELEKGNTELGRISSMLRLAHTLKGAARVVKQPQMAELAHSIEDLLSPYREHQGPVPSECSHEMLRVLDQIGSGLAALDSPAGSTAPAPRSMPEERLGTVRVDVEEVEHLLSRLSEAASEIASVEREVEEVGRARRTAGLIVQQFQARADDGKVPASTRTRTLAEQLLDCLEHAGRRLGESAERLNRDLRQAGELANRIRLLPSAIILPPLARAARDAALALGKQVRFEPSGAEVRLDAQVLTILRDALLQLVRNAVAHGIETVEARNVCGKPRCGRVELSIERRGSNRVAFRCRDDGAGIDVGAIRRIAMKRGIISAAEAEKLGLSEAINLLLRGGLSTAHNVDEISGRGIGLDIVREAVSRLKGEISVVSAPGQGTAVEICVPVSLTAVPALQFASDGTVASLPLESVRATSRYERRQIATCGPLESVVYQAEPIPFLDLSSALGRKEQMQKRERGSMIIVSSGQEMAAIGVDRLLGTATVLVRALPALAPAARVVNGATLDSKGNPQLFLDPAGLIEAASQGRRQSLARLAPIAPILVIDDSLTTRTVEQSILESAGYEVEIAISGEEALEKAISRAYSLFLVDVEMPGIDGFEFVSRTRADARLREIPAILVTSRASAEDRRRGEESGARAYIVKGEFEQGQFLQTVQQLVSR